ncbi:pantetheine-phosphate adenylyltransferase [Candidatus Dependentiae bacterium]|nr:pantetheine-phosphate adenylyltransferase [Candidatus Dependentiae bacterium]
MKSNIGIYPGSFDPITDGHIDIINRATKIFNKVIIAVLKNPGKSFTFSVEERVDMIKDTFKDYDNIEVESFDGLLIDYLKRKNGRAVIRGLRMISDFENEFQMALINRKMSSEFETVFLMTSEEYSFLSSSIVKEIYFLGGDISKFVPGIVLEKIKNKKAIKK